MQAYCDFDGTISKKDVTDLVLDRFAASDWTLIEELWLAGKITSGECMQRQVALIQARLEDLAAFLDEVEIDEHFIAFKRFCDEADIRVTVVSDGVDYFIKHVLARHGIVDVPVIANRLAIDDDAGRTSFRLELPYKRAGCAPGSGVCKCAVVRSAVASGRTQLYVGDGRSDFCVSNEPMLVFAKASLAEHCRTNGIPFIAYEDFGDIRRNLQTILNNAAQAFSVPALSNFASEEDYHAR